MDIQSDNAKPCRPCGVALQKDSYLNQVRSKKHLLSIGEKTRSVVCIMIHPISEYEDYLNSEEHSNIKTLKQNNKLKSKWNVRYEIDMFRLNFEKDMKTRLDMREKSESKTHAWNKAIVHMKKKLSRERDFVNFAKKIDF